MESVSKKKKERKVLVLHTSVWTQLSMVVSKVSLPFFKG